MGPSAIRPCNRNPGVQAEMLRDLRTSAVRTAEAVSFPAGAPGAGRSGRSSSGVAKRPEYI